MAIVENPITGIQKKGFSNAIFQYYYGKNIMRSKPLFYHDANTEKQQKVRQKFSLLNNVVKNFNDVLYYNLKKNVFNLTPYNAAMKLNHENIKYNDLGFIYFDYEKLVLSNGNLENIIITNIIQFDSNTLRIYFNYDNTKLIDNTNYFFQILITDNQNNIVTYSSFLKLDNYNYFDISINNLDINTLKYCYYYTHYNLFDLGYNFQFSDTNKYTF